MNKNDLKNGMKFISKDGGIKYIIENNIYRKEYGNKLEFEHSLDTVKKCFEEDMSYEFNAKFDIMRIFDLKDNLIWERDEEVDWNKVPKDTKVLVRDSKDEDWQIKCFAKYMDGKVFVYEYDTSWESFFMTTWKYTKLAEEPKEEIIVSAKDLHKEFRAMCESHNRCDCCSYHSGTCAFEWILDNYNITKKE